MSSANERVLLDTLHRKSSDGRFDSGGRGYIYMCVTATSLQQSEQIHEHTGNHHHPDNVRRTESIRRVEQRHTLPDRRVQTIQQPSIDTGRERHRCRWRIRAVRHIQRHSVVVPIQRERNAARAIVLDRLLKARICRGARERSRSVRRVRVQERGTVEVDGRDERDYRAVVGEDVECRV